MKFIDQIDLNHQLEAVNAFLQKKECCIQIKKSIQRMLFILQCEEN